jgi:hypothetical protein
MMSWNVKSLILIAVQPLCLKWMTLQLLLLFNNCDQLIGYDDGVWRS